MGTRQTAHIAGQVAQVVLIAGITAVLAGGSAMAETSGIITHTELATATHQVSGRTIQTFTATVLGEDGAPATGSVTLVEGNHRLASAALNSAGKAEIRYDALPAGYHGLTAIYNGDAIHLSSQSANVTVHPEAAASADFALAINVVGGTDATTMTIAAPGDSGSLTATVTPTAGLGFTGFISLSCSGAPASSGSAGGTSLPVGVTCTFAPANLQIVKPTTANPTAAQTADMALVTTTGQQTVAKGLESGPLALAILLPGIVGLGYLGRRRKVLTGVAMMALLGTFTLVGTTGCAARYRYLNHGPTFGGTPAGSYTITITAQTSDGVTSSSQSQTLNLVVK
jgi:hypothetical protein